MQFYNGGPIFEMPMSGLLVHTLWNATSASWVFFNREALGWVMMVMVAVDFLWYCIMWVVLYLLHQKPYNTKLLNLCVHFLKNNLRYVSCFVTPKLFQKSYENWTVLRKTIIHDRKSISLAFKVWRVWTYSYAVWICSMNLQPFTCSPDNVARNMRHTSKYWKGQVRTSNI